MVDILETCRSMLAAAKEGRVDDLGRALHSFDWMIGEGGHVDEFIERALFCASRAGHVAVVERLLALGHAINPASDCHSPMRAAASQGHAGVVRVLLADARINWTHMVFDVLQVGENVQALWTLLESGRAPASPAPVCGAECREEYDSLKRRLLADPRTDAAALVRWWLWQAAAPAARWHRRIPWLRACVWRR
jgi:hypothetical protein